MRGTALLRLCQLVSPALPVGAFNFSQGLEYAVAAGWVTDEAAAGDWIGGLARCAIGTLDLPLLLRLHAAWQTGDEAAALRWSARLIAARETRELRAEDRHMGSALAKILRELGVDGAAPWIGHDDASFAALFALAACRWDISGEDCACGYLWAWTENQVLAAVKLIPLGQTAGQRLLDRLIGEIPRIVADAAAIAEEDIGIAAPTQGLASALHETQYTRLFRS
jgi:urease accessory protein